MSICKSWLFPLLLAFASAMPAQQYRCPDMITEEKKADYTVGPLQMCSSGITIQFSGVSVNLPPNTCPLFVLFEPSYDYSKHREGSRTFTRPSHVEPVVRVGYQCVNDYFLFIYLGSSCVESSSANIGTRTNYEQLPCWTADSATTG